MINLMLGDCLERMKEIPDNSVDSIVTDPPYGLSFMGKHWDKGVPSAEIWAEALRVLKPGGHLLAFAGTRTQHRMAVNIEDAGFDIRDMIAWVYGSGFPKSLNVSKAIDKAAGAEREVIAVERRKNAPSGIVGAGRESVDVEREITAPATEAAKQWDGWGTALKPALEPITVARKPFKGTVAANVQEHGTGAINIDGCRVGTDIVGWGGSAGGSGETTVTPGNKSGAPRPVEGRWPANLIHDGSDEVVGLFPVTGPSKASPRNNADYKSQSKGAEKAHTTYGHDDAGGSAARFFYCAKASKKDRDEGLTNEPVETAAMQGNLVNNQRLAGNGAPIKTPVRKNNHPTVKPTDLMRYLCRLVTPPAGVVLDPFMGSGSTGKAAMLEGFRFVGIELDQGYFDIASKRIAEAQA